jgi:hypothetical protein
VFPFPSPLLLQQPIIYDTDATAYFAAMTSQPTNVRKGLINDLFVGLKADSVYSKLDFLHLIASHDAQAATLNAINPATATITLSGTPTFTTDLGYTTDGSTNFLNTNRANNGGTNYTQNSASFGIYVNNSPASANPSMAGAFSGAVGTTINPFSAGSTSTWRCNCASASTITAGGSPNNGNGLSAAVRNSSSDMRGYRNGSQVGSTSAAASTALTADTFKYGAITTVATRGARFALGFAGAALSATDNANLYTRLLTFLTAIGAN